MTKTRHYFALGIMFLIAVSCSDDEVQITLEASDFTATIDENPESSAELGSLTATSNSTQEINFQLISQSVEGAISISDDGAVTVEDETVFDFETNQTITGMAMATVEGVSDKIALTISVNDVEEVTFNIWSGSKITFEKADGVDPTLEANQDRITDNVWITRGNGGGEIYNAVVESSSTKNVSPIGTEWALGRTSNISSLTFNSFRMTISPNEVVDKDLVLHLIDDDIYIDIKFLSWTAGGGGGFSYERSTE